MNSENPVFRSLEIIESRISEKLTVGCIAGGVHFSKYHYQRLFREILSGSVMEYVTRRRLTLAGRDLLETGAGVVDVALKYGYESHEGFTRSFKAYMGVTPTDYRKYGLSAISQKSIKEKCVLTYSKATDEIIRELNEFIVKAKETAALTRKCELPELKSFFELIAGVTDGIADKARGVLDRITSIAERPDEITNRFAIIKIIEDVAFNSNLLALHTGLHVARASPGQMDKLRPLADRYLELARICVMKAEKALQFFNELAALIVDDMRRAAAEKMRALIKAGADAAGKIEGYLYIKDEVRHLADALSAAPVESITVSELEDYLFRLNIIAFAADVDATRCPKDKPMFDGIAAFRESLSDAIEFFRLLVRPDSGPVTIARSARQHLQDIAYQGNILLFYTRGEVSYEKLGRLLNDAQKAAFDAICDKVNDFIRRAHGAEDVSAYGELAGRLCGIHADMIKEADDLKEYGTVIKFLAVEYKALADRIVKLAEMQPT